MKNTHAFSRSVFLYGFLSSLFLIAGSAQGADTEDAQKISGVLVDKDGRPVPDALVRPKLLARGFESLEVVTDSNGRFEFDRPNQWFDALLAQTPDGSLMGTVPLENDTELKIVLLPSRTITGTVIGADGKPLPDVFVLGVSGYSEAIRTQTDAEGRFAFRFPEDTPLRVVVALKDGLGMDYVWTMETPTTAEYRLFGWDGDPSQRKKSDGPFELRLEGARPVRCKIVDEEGRPVEGITVYPWYFAKEDRPENLNIGTDLKRRISGPDGGVEFDFFPAWQTQGVTFCANEDREEIHKTMQYRFLENRTFVQPESFNDENEIIMLRAVTVRGTVRFPDGRPAVGWQFRAQGGSDQFEQRITDSEGRYAVPVVPGSTVNFSVERPQGPLGEKIEEDWACRPRRDVDIGEESIVSEDFVLEKGTKISGTATAGDERKPIEEASILITPLTPEEAEAEAADNVRCSWWATIKNGRYEFYTTPGDYRLRCQSGKGDTKLVKLESGKELTVDFHVEETRRDKKQLETLRGKIQTGDDPPRPVAGAKITCQTFDFDFHELYQKTFSSDENGEFAIPAGTMSVYVQAVTADGKQGIIAKVSPTEKNLVLVPKPLATITGKMVHKKTQEPVLGRRIECSIRIPGEETQFQFSTSGFRCTTFTDENGVYRFAAVPVGLEYEISCTQRPRGEPDDETGGTIHYERIAAIEPESPLTDCGTFQYAPNINGSSEYLWTFFNAYSNVREKSDFEGRFKLLLERCKRDGKNLLVVFAPTEVFEGDLVSEIYGRLPGKLLDLMYDTRGKAFETADRFYLMGIPTDAKVRHGASRRFEAGKFVKLRGIDEKVLDEMTLCFFDADGRLLGSESIDGISEYGGDSENKPKIDFKRDAVIELLKKYVPGE